MQVPGDSDHVASFNDHMLEITLSISRCLKLEVVSIGLIQHLNPILLKLRSSLVKTFQDRRIRSKVFSK